MNPKTQALTGGNILRFWLPLQATWLMMAFEGPFLAALIARLAEPKFNLAAFGVSLALAMIAEAPIIMMLSAANALAADRIAYLKLRRFTFCLNTAITAALAVVLIPPLFSLLARDGIGLPPEVARLSWLGTLLLLPWPAAIGYRRFFQGVLIRSGNTRAVACGTLVRLSTMGLTGLALALGKALPGAAVGAAALSAGVVMEAAASRFMARGAVRSLLAQPEGGCAFDRGLSYAAIWKFYLPLALTSFLTLAMHPLIIFFVGRSQNALESLAVIPVVNSLAFVFRSPGIAFQEATIALLGEGGNRLQALRRFAWKIGLAATAAMGAMTWLPLAEVWFCRVSGLSRELAAFAFVPGRIAALLPLVEALISFQRGLLVSRRRTGLIIAATALQVFTLFVLLLILVNGLRWIGANAAAAAQACGYLAAALFLSAAGRSKRGLGADTGPPVDMAPGLS